MKPEFFIARRIASSDGRISGFSNKIAVFSIAVSILVMLIASSISNGFNREIRSTVSGLIGDFYLTPAGIDLFDGSYPVPSDLSVRKEIAAIDGVAAVTPFIYSAGVLKNEDRIEGLLFKGVDSTYNRHFFSNVLTEGRLPEFTGNRASDELLISSRMAEKANLKTGDRAVVYFIGERTRIRQFTVCGIYNAVMEDLDEKLVLADLRVLQRLNGWKSEVSGFEVACRGGVDARTLDSDIERALFLSDDSELLPGYPSDIFPAIYDWLQMLDYNLLLILALMLIVAGFNMVSSLLIMLFEKISMIGILKSLGMTNQGITRIFLYKAALLLGRGFLYGNVIAAGLILFFKYVLPIGLDASSYFVSTVPFYLSFWWWAGINMLSFVLILLILTLPLLFINRVNPAATVKMK